MYPEGNRRKEVKARAKLIKQEKPFKIQSFSKAKGWVSL